MLGVANAKGADGEERYYALGSLEEQQVFSSMSEEQLQRLDSKISMLQSQQAESFMRRKE